MGALLLLLTALDLLSGHGVNGWGSYNNNDPGKVLLKDVQTLTLHADRMTTGRRSSPVPQLNCIGGSAQGKFTPKTVQCYNRGFDGVDVQWECKADMDNLYRFGSVEVICEGYDYPDDPFILKGSCGLEYTLEYTQEGEEKARKASSWFGSSNTHHHHNSYYHHGKSSSSGWGDWILLFVVGIVIYAMYKSCFPPERNIGDHQYR